MYVCIYAAAPQIGAKNGTLNLFLTQRVYIATGLVECFWGSRVKES